MIMSLAGIVNLKLLTGRLYRNKRPVNSDGFKHG